MPLSPEGSDGPGVGVTGGCELLNMDTRNSDWFSARAVCALNLWAVPLTLS